MKLNNLLNEASGGDYEKFPGEYKHGDSCPVCGLKLKNRYTRMGPPSFVACKNKHAFDLPQSEKVEYAEFDPVEFWKDWSAGVEEQKASHTCGLEKQEFRGKPLEGRMLEKWYRNHSDPEEPDYCKACDQSYDLIISGGWEEPPLVAQDDKPEEIDVRSALQKLAELDPRSAHQPGEFGTGRRQPIKADDPLVIQALKAFQNKGIQRNPETGELYSRKGSGVGAYKPRCGYKHTCWGHPSGRPAWNYPMPDPMAASGSGKQRYNFMFEYSPRDTRRWPVSGLSGYKPKAEYEDYINSKLTCPVCSGMEEGCDNPVSTEYGAPKPFCTEHIGETPYAKELLGKFGGVGLPGQPDPTKDYKEKEVEFRQIRKKAIRKGDEVKFEFKKPGAKGTGELVGIVVEIDPEMEDRTHRVKWENPKAEALRYTWEDPEKLDLLY